MCSGFTDFYFVFEDLFVEIEASDMNTIVPNIIFNIYIFF